MSWLRVPMVQGASSPCPFDVGLACVARQPLLGYELGYRAWLKALSFSSILANCLASGLITRVED